MAFHMQRYPIGATYINAGKQERSRQNGGAVWTRISLEAGGYSSKAS